MQSQWLLFPKNLGTHLSLDETAFNNGDLYNSKGKEGRFSGHDQANMIKPTKADVIMLILHKNPLKQRKKVKEVTLNMAGNIGLTVKNSFPKRHLGHRTFQCSEIRWEALDTENNAIKSARNKSLKI